MPGRVEPIVTGQIYHIFNKSIDSREVFVYEVNCSHFVDLLRYYRSTKANISFSTFRRLKKEIRGTLLEELSKKKYFIIEILSYCLMPTHFHLLLMQRFDDGIMKFASDVSNAFTKYYNKKNKRVGPIFIPRFKAERIRDDSQLIHVARYIDLNPYSGGITKKVENLEKYPWSSFREYVADVRHSLCDTGIVLEHFGGDRMAYKLFVLERADYQKTLEEIKHLNSW